MSTDPDCVPVEPDDDFRARVTLEGQAPEEGQQNPVAGTAYGRAVDAEAEDPARDRREDTPPRR